MDFIEEVKMLSKQFAIRINHLDTEEATKNSLVLPFFQMLGYAIFDPTEVVPEFTADVGIKRGEKVDYALAHNGKPAILVECKSYGSPLGDAEVSQLLRYFQNAAARFGVLTDGVTYRFFSDLDKPNVMDTKPFFEFNMLEFTESQVEELKQFTKSNFREAKIVERAYRLKYIKAIKSKLAQERSDPSDGFVRFIMRPIYAGTLTKKVVEEFQPVVREAFGEFINERIADRLKSALDQTEPPGPVPIDPEPAPDPVPPPSPGDWTPLRQIANVAKQKPPTAIRINSGETLPVRYWWQVLSEVAGWLVKEGHLTRADLPIDGGRGWTFINSDPHTPDGRDFRVSKRIADDIYLDMNRNANSTIKCSKQLLSHYSIEYEIVELRFA